MQSNVEFIRPMSMGLIYKKLANIAAQIQPVPKNSKNKDDNYSFRSIYDIYNRLQPIFKSEGVFLVPNIIESAETVVNTNKGRAFRVKVKVEWTLYAEDGSKISSITQGEGIDASDKASNKALTASLKYLLIYMFLIPTVGYEVDADFNSPTIDPFEKSPQVEQPKSLLALVESKGLTREHLKMIGKKLEIKSQSDLTIEERKELFDLISSKSRDELLKFIS